MRSWGHGGNPSPRSQFAKFTPVVRRESCTVLAGASPVSVSAGAPSSRVQSWVERPRAERTVESLAGGSDEAARNRVNAEQASSEFQPKGDWERRAGHVTAKATHSPRSRPASGSGAPRGRGGGTFRQNGVEHERPVSTA